MKFHGLDGEIMELTMLLDIVPLMCYLVMLSSSPSSQGKIHGMLPLHPCTPSKHSVYLQG